MNRFQGTPHIYIDTNTALDAFYEENKSISWLGFDTEFVGERTYFPILCLVQVATENGNYLIDTMVLKNIDPFLKFITDPNIVKITHAGENDYRMLYQDFGILPKNVFDTQVAAGFIGYNYPISFANLLIGELKVSLDKGPAVSDWESRPISNKQLQYALNDVIYLEELWQKITQKLKSRNRESWVTEEFDKMQAESSYAANPNKEFYANSMLSKISFNDKLFLLRLYRWRIDMAEKRNLPKERILQKKLISHIVKGAKGGRKSLLQNRLIPSHVVDKNVDTFTQLYQLPISDQEKEIIEAISNDKPVKPRIDAVMDILYLGIKVICSQNKIAPELVVNRPNFKKMKSDLTYYDESLSSSWRKELLGGNVINSIKNRTALKIDTESEFFGLKM